MKLRRIADKYHSWVYQIIFTLFLINNFIHSAILGWFYATLFVIDLIYLAVTFKKNKWEAILMWGSAIIFLLAFHCPKDC